MPKDNGDLAHQREASYHDAKAESLVETKFEDNLVLENLGYGSYCEAMRWKDAVRLIGNFKGKVLVDVGCGTGKNSLILANLGAQVTGIDVSEKCVTIAKEWAKKRRIKAKFLIGAAEELDRVFAPSTVDVVVFHASLHHVSNVDAAIGAAQAVLKPGGILVALEPKLENPVATISRRFVFQPSHDEHPFKMGELEPTIQKHFGEVHTRYYCIASPLYLGLNNLKMKKLSYVFFKGLNVVDKALLSADPLKKLTWLELVWGKKRGNTNPGKKTQTIEQSLNQSNKERKCMKTNSQSGPANIVTNVDAVLQNVVDPSLRNRARLILQNVEISLGNRVLEVGCGFGFYEAILPVCFPGTEIVGIDINRAELLQAIREVASKNADLFFVLADGANLPFKDAQFDRVICSEVLEHIPKDEPVIAEIFRTQKPDGKTVISVPNKNYPFMWDPFNYVQEKATGSHIPSKFQLVTGIWTNHLRLYTEEELLGKLRKNGFCPTKLLFSTHYCLPFSHFLLTTVINSLAKIRNKNAVQPIRECSSEVDLNGFAGRSVKLVQRAFSALDKFNSNDCRAVSTANIVVTLEK